jgi:hypothetical protein
MHKAQGAPFPLPAAAAFFGARTLSWGAANSSHPAGPSACAVCAGAVCARALPAHPFCAPALAGSLVGSTCHAHSSPGSGARCTPLPLPALIYSIAMYSCHAPVDSSKPEVCSRCPWLCAQPGGPLAAARRAPLCCCGGALLGVDPGSGARQGQRRRCTARCLRCCTCW